MRRIVLFDFYEWEITLRELLFSVLIIGVMFGTGYLISDSISKSENDRCLAYRQASQITDDVEFRHAVETGIGNAFFEGHVKAKDPVSHSKLSKKQYLSIDLTYESYNMHVSTYTTYDSKGRPHTHVKTYWTWDTYKHESLNASKVIMKNVELESSMFNFIHDGERHVRENGYHKRIVFNCIPKEFNGVGYAFLSPDMKAANDNNIDFYEGKDIKWLYDYNTSSYKNAIFWSIWSLLMILSIFIFFYVDNEWLEDDNENKYIFKRSQLR